MIYAVVGNNFPVIFNSTMRQKGDLITLPNTSFKSNFKIHW